jgi:conjugative transposon TraK protein
MIKNIENKIKLSLVVSLGAFFTSIVLAVSVIVFASNQISEARKKIYVVDHGIPILATQTDGSETRDIEQKSHVELFHSLFFTLPPDDEYIKNNIQKAMYLIDESGNG